MKLRILACVVLTANLAIGQTPRATLELTGFEPNRVQTRWSLSLAKGDATSRTVRVVRFDPQEPRAFAWRDVSLTASGHSISAEQESTTSTNLDLNADRLAVVRWDAATDRFLAVGHRSVSGRHEGAFGDWTQLVILECKIDGTGRARTPGACAARGGRVPTDP